MSDYVKLERGKGIESPNGHRMSSRHVEKILTLLDDQESHGYVFYRSQKGYDIFPLNPTQVARLGAQPPRSKRRASRRIYRTHSSPLVLQAIKNNYLYGFEIMEATKLGSGTVYKTLNRLEETGLVIGEWESNESLPNSRPARKYYSLTPHGEQHLHSLRTPPLGSEFMKNLLALVPSKTVPVADGV